MKISDSLADQRLLKKSGHTFGNKNYLEDLELLIFVTDLHLMQIKFVNTAAGRYLTLPGENIFNKTADEAYQKLLHPEDYQDFMSHIHSLQNISEDTVENISVRIKTKSSTTKKFLFRHRLYLGETRENRFLIGIAKETPISEQNHNSTAAHECIKGAIIKSQNINSMLLKNINEGFCIIDVLFDAQKSPVDCVFLETNTSFERQVELTNFNEKTMKEIFPKHEEHWLLNFGMVAIKRETVKFHSYTKEPNRTWFNVNAFPIGDDEVGHVGVLFNDVNQEKLPEEKLLASSSKIEKNPDTISADLRKDYELLKTISPDIIMILNLQEDNVRYINRDMASHPGMRKKDIDGLPISQIIPFIHPYDREKAMDFHKKITQATDKAILEMELRLKTKDDHWEWYSARGKVFMRNRETEVCEYILMLRNVEQQKRTQQALVQAEKLSIKGEVARTLAHELRNPMASIGMAADILSKKLRGQRNPDLENYLGLIRRSTTTLNKLVTDLLNSSNYSPFFPEKCCLAETLDNALKAAGDRIYLVGIKVKKKYTGHYFILADQEKLKIALLNLIVNASEAMNPDEGILSLKISRKPQDFELTIEDNGCGMKKNQLEKLFDAFYTGKPHGVGVGLSSVKSILEEHGAKIQVTSKLNKGTKFQLTFRRYETFERT